MFDRSKNTTVSLELFKGISTEAPNILHVAPSSMLISAQKNNSLTPEAPVLPARNLCFIDQNKAVFTVTTPSAPTVAPPLAVVPPAPKVIVCGVSSAPACRSSLINTPWFVYPMVSWAAGFLALPPPPSPPGRNGAVAAGHFNFTGATFLTV